VKPDNIDPLPSQRCPHCGGNVAAFIRNPNNAQPPKPHAVCLCSGCAGLLCIDAELRVQPFTAEDFLRLPREHQLRLARMRKQLVLGLLELPAFMRRGNA
jgi:hypothetical protein